MSMCDIFLNDESTLRTTLEQYSEEEFSKKTMISRLSRDSEKMAKKLEANEMLQK